MPREGTCRTPFAALLLAHTLAACSGSTPSSATPEAPAGASGSAGDGASMSAAPAVRYLGRFDLSAPEGARFAWSGSGLVARFSGSSVGVRLAGGQQYTVLLDGVEQAKLVSTGNLDEIASGLASGEHQVELYRRTEASQGEAQFLGFEFDGGQLLEPPAPRERRIEVIGDSISCGYGNEGPNERCGFTPDTENHYLTYGALAARALGADLTTIAWSGKGVVCNYGDDPTSCTDPMPSYFDRALPSRADSRWDFAMYQPQAVVINLGTNDFSTAADPTSAEFEAAYVELLERIRNVYPEATILCTVGPLLTGADLTTARTAIAAAVAARVNVGDERVTTFELAPQDAANGLGCDYHPSLRTHELMAEALTTALRAALAW